VSEVAIGLELVFQISFFGLTRSRFYAAFPLILTFSLREKEQPLADTLKSSCIRAAFSRRFAKKLGAFLPLPVGEGKGEGEQIFHHFVGETT
jgi:hypothetical protein